jgi:Zn-dependent M28 family amino/carboxypeptidase
MFVQLQRGERVRGRDLSGRDLEIRIQIRRRRGACRNVAAMVEGRDEKLKSEYVLLGAHHDHLGAREGGIFNGADDNGSGTVALLEIAQALMFHRPRRSVILVWHTAEEKGLWGSRFFMEHSPVPVEKMSAEINLDMLCRNDPGSLFLIGSNKLSSQFDAALQAANRRELGFRLDYTYQEPGHPENFFFRSDHYPYIQYGVPAVWIFCGTTEDYHRETDTMDRVDSDKLMRAARLTYFAALKIGDLPDLLRLNLHPEVKTRGAHNLKVKWR